MPKIKNVLFDLGGVLLNIDYQKTAIAFTQLGVQQFDELYSQAAASDLFEALETGDITEDDFYAATLLYCAPSTTRQQMETAWNAMLLNFRISGLNHLETLGKHYAIYLLSNTNSIHLRAFNTMFQQQTGKTALDDYFIKAYYSHLIHQRKPNVATYTSVLADAGLLAEETLFVDDSINNIIAAKQAGLQVHHLLPNEQIENLIIDPLVAAIT